MEALGDISKLKVADLKKELKIRGLAVTGNKNELVERLQQALSSGAVATGTVGEEEEEFDEEEILGGADTDMSDISKMTPQEEEAALNGPSIQPKKTSAAEKKKITLKRASTAPAAAEPAEKTAKTDVSDVNKENEVQSVVPTKKAIKPISVDSNTITEDKTEKSEEVTEKKVLTPKEARAARFGMVTSPDSDKSTTKSNKLSSDVGEVTVDKLKARATRFGEVTSKQLSKLEIEQKKKQRKERFGASTTIAASAEKTTNDSSAEADTQQQSQKGGLVGAAAAVLAQDELKRKRSERFGK